MTDDKKRWLYAVNGIIALLFLGLIYAWSVFVGPLESEFGWVRSQTSLTFSISMGAFCIGVIAGGILSRRRSGRLVMWLAAVFVLTGFLLASTISTLTGLYICYGVVCGFGVGLGYIAVLNSVLAWFPDRQGMISGILLMGFGFGGSVFGTVAVSLMTSFGWRTTFRALGIAMGVLLVLSSLLLKRPEAAKAQKPSDAPENGEDMTTAQMVRERSFRGYFVWSMLLSATGLALISGAVSFAGSIVTSLTTATTLAGLINIFNGIGRLVFGFLLDILGSKKSLLMITCGLLAGSLLLVLAVTSDSVYLLAAGFILTGFFYGGITPSNSAYTSKVFGMTYYSTNFSIMNLVLLVAAFLGPFGAEMLQTASGDYLTTAVMMGVFCVLSFPFLLLINRHTAGKALKK